MGHGLMLRYNQKQFGVRRQTLERLEKLYDESYFQNRFGEGTAEYKRDVEKREKMYQLELERVKTYVKNFSSGGNALDIGCGRGEFLALLGDNWQKYGIEVSDHARTIAEKNGVITDFEPQDNFFDLIIFRGTIQHIPDPVYKISECFYWLKKGGAIIFLATPNIHSIVYRLFKNLPMIEEKLNFLLPSDKVLRQILTNFGFQDIKFEYPYFKTPYARPVYDLVSFLLRLIGIKNKLNFAFYGNMLECYARKP